MATYGPLKEELWRAEVTGAARILLDLREVTFIDSTGIRTLLEAERRSAANGHWLRLLPVSGQVRRMLELCGVLERFDFTD